MAVSNHVFNRLHNLRMVCPITNTDRGLPFHVRLDARTRTTGVILCDQARTLDLAARNAAYSESLPPDLLAEVVDIIIGSIEIP